VGPDTEKLHDPYHDSRERGILKSWREHDRRHERPDAVDTGMHMSVRYDGAVRRRHLPTNVLSLNRICSNPNQVANELFPCGCVTADR